MYGNHKQIAKELITHPDFDAIKNIDLMELLENYIAIRIKDYKDAIPAITSKLQYIEYEHKNKINIIAQSDDIAGELIINHGPDLYEECLDDTGENGEYDSMQVISINSQKIDDKNSDYDDKTFIKLLLEHLKANPGVRHFSLKVKKFW